MVWRSYVVGSQNISGVGDQKKHFISKSLLLYSDIDVNIKLNNMNNVTIVILADTWYEFKSNIHTVFVDCVVETPETSYIYLYPEGVLYDEARRPE